MGGAGDCGECKGVWSVNMGMDKGAGPVTVKEGKGGVSSYSSEGNGAAEQGGSKSG